MFFGGFLKTVDLEKSAVSNSGKKAFILSVLISSIIISGCLPHKDKVQSQNILLGFSQLGTESAWRSGNTADIVNKAKASKVSLMMENGNRRQEDQIAAIRRFIAYQVDVIAFSPIVEEGWDNVLLEAKDAGIPVVLVDRDISTDNPDLISCKIGADFYNEGVMAADYLIRKADSLGKKEIKIVEITGTKDSTPMRKRQSGFMDTIKKDSRMTVIESINGDFLKSCGAECMRHLMKKYGSEIDVVFSHNDEMTLGALPEIEKAGLLPGKDIVIISIDAGQEAINVLKEGKINCVVECTPMLGKELMDTATKLKNGEKVEKVIHPKEGYFCDEQDLSELSLRGY